ncbi:MAG: hypothetical protein NC344_00940 [Bacteroidales bacterium]|nr:hypothetical protein [Bacteroidales bacterium]MCM1146403.1 hypothetical protein [Bacteroidales bacterium]MCM1205159.1 hypothetical protein [Bacillota bacterium]MCM1509406.1 hypothetical protein [Clostridium sp.]
MTQATDTTKGINNIKNMQKVVTYSRKADAKIRRNINKRWRMLEKSPRYRSAVTREVFCTTMRKIEVEVLDGIFLNLKMKSREKSPSVQDRILRRIIEKRQAQANHRKNGRSEDLTSVHVSITCTSRCMERIRMKRHCLKA